MRIRSGSPAVSSVTSGLGQPRQRVVDRIADMAVVDMHAVGRRRELDDLAGVERLVDGRECVLARSPVLDDRIGDLAERRAHGMDAFEVLGRDPRPGDGVTPQAIGPLAMDQAVVCEPGEDAFEGRQTLAWETIVVVEGVQEVEGGLHVDVVGVARIEGVEGGLRLHRCNHFRPLDRLRARGYCTSNR